MNAEQILNNLFDIVEKLSTEMKSLNNDHHKVFELFSELGRTSTQADRASFWQWNKATHKLITATATGVNQIIIDDNTGLVGRAIKENRTIITNDPKHHPDFNSAVDDETGYVTKSILVMPVSNCRGEVIGAFQVINKNDETGFNEVDDVKRLSLAAFICGMALESDLFLADSQHDKLTELKNRLGFHCDYQSRYQNIIYDSKLSVIMCDIDHFKRINDTYGHNGGDEVLRIVAKLLKSSIRDSDCAYRWGGEEFIIILDGANLSIAESIAERIRKSIEETIVNLNDQKISLTMSFGCTEFSIDKTFDDNLKTADINLYQAKNTGRNKVIAK